MRHISDSIASSALMQSKNIKTFLVEQTNFTYVEMTTFSAATTLNQFINDVGRIALFRVIKTDIPLSIRLHNKGLNRSNARPITPCMSSNMATKFVDELELSHG